MNSPDVNRLFSCFAESPKRSKSGNTLKAFIFSLKNSEALPPFKCLVENELKAIYMSSSYGPSFGAGPFLYIVSQSQSKAVIGDPYSVPKEVLNEETVLAGTPFFTPDNYEVFYLAETSILEKNKQANKEIQ